MTLDSSRVQLLVPPNSRYAAVLKRALYVWLAMSSGLANAGDDQLEEKLRVGITRDAAIAIVGTEPTEEACKTTLGIRVCRLSFTRMLSSKRYEVDLLGDRLISVASCDKALPRCSE